MLSGEGGGEEVEDGVGGGGYVLVIFVYSKTFLSRTW